MKRTALRIFPAAALPLLLAAAAQQANSAEFYIGDAAPEGQAVTAAGGPRADTVGTLTYILHTGAPTIYTAPSDQELVLTEVNFFADASGTLTPFVARYLGGSTQSATSYEILSVGDPFVVTSSDGSLGPSGGDHLENREFTVDSVNPTISVVAGDMIVAGWLQVGNVVYISGGAAQGAADYIANGDSLSGASIGGAPTLNSNWAFDRPMQFNIGFEVGSGATPFKFRVDASGSDLVFTWDSQDGRLYNLLSETGLDTEPIAWPIFGGNQDMAATPPENNVTIPRPPESERFFVIQEFPAPPVMVFFDDFENGQGLWSADSDGAAGTAWELGPPSSVGPTAAHSPTNCFGTNRAGNYAPEANVWLRSAPIDLTTAGDATLNYYEFRDIEEGFDFGTVALLDAADDSELAVLRSTVDGISNGWEAVRESIPAAALGHIIKLEFRFQSDDIGSFAGWYLDDVEVTVP